MSDINQLLAIDLGASSGRVILGTCDGKTIRTEEIHRFANTPIQAGEHLHWDVPHLFKEMKLGIRKAALDHGRPLSVSVDTWGVDYGFLDQRGRLLSAPHHYRDQRMNAYRSRLEELLPPAEQFRLTGNQPALINTVYQLFADLQENPGLLEHADQILMMPDLFHYLFSGNAAAERTILSTGGLLAAGTGDPSPEVFSRLGIPQKLIADRVQPGTVIGTLLPGLREELGCGELKIVAGASHDTASAVASIPYTDKEHAAFISCGTWSLVGMETEAPVLSELCYSLGFTNEGCFGGGNRLLKNLTGLWLLQETQRVWAEAGEKLSFAEMTELAEQAGPAEAYIDPNDPLFAAPGDMPERIAACCRNSGQPQPAGKGAVVRVILESLARSYGQAVEELEKLTGRRIRRIHMVGGGIQNRLLCRLTADRTGREIVAGPVEASALGNLLVQLSALELLDFARAREMIAASESLAVYQPH